jgi:solute carrier family 25 2-oxodicarboxylate transporter 21
MSEKKIPFWKDCTMQIAAGGTAGFTEICLLHPLDVVKTRFQVQKGNIHNSIGGCFRTIIKNEGYILTLFLLY